MAERYEDDRWRWREDDRNRRPFDRDRSERNMVERGADEVRSWFGDDEAQRRRAMDEQRERSYEGSRWRGPYGEGRGVSGIGREWNGGRSQEGAWEGGGRPGWQRPESYGARNDNPGYDDRGSYYRDRFDRSIAGELDRDPRQARDGERHRSGYFDSSMGYASAAGSGDLNPFRYRGAGAFAGRGPKNFLRSDERIREDVVSRLTDDGRVDASDIDVQVQNGEVTLAGAVESRRMRRAAEECVEDLPGVRDVHNQLRVESHGSNGRDSNAGAIGHEGSQLEREDVTSLNISGAQARAKR
jgi:hypothetical protein